jgi:hypothetical protein
MLFYGTMGMFLLLFKPCDIYLPLEGVMDSNPTFKSSISRSSSPDERKLYTAPAILISLPLEASAGTSVIGRPAGTDSGDGWDDEW